MVNCARSDVVLLLLLSTLPLFGVDSKIDLVTVFPDRATVVRTAKISLSSAGEHLIEMSGIPSAADASTVRLKGTGTGKMAFGAVQMTKDYAPPDSGRIAEIEERLKVINDELQALVQRRQAIDIERGFLSKIGDISAGSATDELKAGTVNALAYDKTFAFLDDKLTGLADRQVELSKTERDLKDERIRLQRERSNLGYGVDKGYIAEFTIKNNAAGTANVELSYTVWNSGWYPAYDARSNSETGAVGLTYYGIVRQRSGEDWDDVKIVLSTSRPSLGARAPKLEPWYLNVLEEYRRRETRVGMSKMGAAAPQSPMMALSTEGIEESADFFEPAPIEHIVAEAAVSGGGSVQFEIPGRADIPADNSIKKLVVGEFQFDMEETYICVPKITEFAYLRAKFTNETEFPLLAGAVSIFQGQNYVGDSNIEFVAPGEEVELSMGVTEAIKVERKILKEFAAKGGFFGGKRKRAYAYRTEIVNNLSRAIEIEIFEQTPVSRDSRIEIEDIEYLPKLDDKPERGIFSWKINIPAGEKKNVEIRFIVIYPKDLDITGL